MKTVQRDLSTHSWFFGRPSFQRGFFNRVNTRMPYTRGFAINVGLGKGINNWRKQRFIEDVCLPYSDVLVTQNPINPYENTFVQITINDIHSSYRTLSLRAM